ncbi:MAG: PAS domain-containing sensor histidine kinase [Campylobacterota bacterium]|nr:PAS domain-containing sensor histidine kinase [Campylobacterota bacterium]
MSSSSIKQNNILIILFEIIGASLTLFLLLSLSSLEKEQTQEIKNQLDMQKASNLLRHSSDNLTHFARTYVVTGDELYKEQYFKTLDIRNGKIARPLFYDSVYWDIEKSLRQTRHPETQKLALKEIFKTLPFTKKELALLTLSEKNSNDLVELEVRAFEAMKKGDRELAVELMHSKEYYGAKHKIMNPIDEFIMLSSSRISRELEENRSSVFLLYMALAFMVLLFAVGHFIIFKTLQKALEETIEKQTETLKKHRDRLNFAIDGSSDGMWDWDIVNDKVFFSPRWKEMLGYADDEIENIFDEWQSRVHPDDLPKVFELIELNMSGKESTFEILHRMKHKDGHWVWILDRAKTLYDENGKAIMMSGFHTDVTERKELELSLEEEVKLQTAQNIKQHELLQQQSKMAAMGEMIGAIAHQWRQPLNELGLSIQNLKYDYKAGAIDEAFIKEFIAYNRNTIMFMSRTIDDFRSFFRVDKEKHEFGVKETTESTVAMLSAQIKSHDINIEVSGDEFVYSGYKSEFQQVILNLINNAKDALLENNTLNPLIKIQVEDNFLSVADNAGGISEDITKRVFEPYFTTKEQGKGTGMGLYMSKMIIEENMDGKLSVKNGDDGAIFSIML